MNFAARSCFSTVKRHIAKILLPVLLSCSSEGRSTNGILLPTNTPDSSVTTTQHEHHPIENLDVMTIPYTGEIVKGDNGEYYCKNRIVVGTKQPMTNKQVERIYSATVVRKIG